MSTIEIPPEFLSKLALKSPNLVVELHINTFVLCIRAEMQSKPTVPNNYHE
jgi:hypothetical protein